MTALRDVTIVGASFAGLACAQHLARRGIDVLIIDRQAAPGARIHTTGILVKEAAEAWAVPHTLTRRIHGVRLYAPNGRFIDLERPGYYFLATDTAGLLRWFTEQVRDAGAEIRHRTPFVAGRQTPDRVWINQDAWASRMLIGADGAKSRVAQQFGLGRNGRFLIGVEEELVGVRGLDADRLHVFIDSRLAPGYIAWAVPSVGGLTQIGVARQFPGHVALAEFKRRLGLVADLSRAEIVERRGGLIPVGGVVAPLGDRRVVLTGDAAGLVSPLTAGGIHTAIHFGRATANAVGDYLQDRGDDPTSTLAAQLPSFRFKRWLRAALELRPPNWAINAALSLPPLKAVAQTVFFHHRGLWSMAAWRDLLRGGPRRLRTG